MANEETGQNKQAARNFVFANASSANDQGDVVAVRGVPQRPNVQTGKPRNIALGNQRIKTAFPVGGDMIGGAGGNMYSPELSTDFMMLPQSMDAQRDAYRFFFLTEPFVSQAIRLHGELPLSKLRLGRPRAKSRELADRSLRFCEKWARRVGLLHRLIEIIHDYFLIGETFVFAEDTTDDMPREITHMAIREITADGELRERWDELEDADARETAWMKKNYKGWSALTVIPPEQVHLETFGFTQAKIIELIPDSKTRAVIEDAATGDERAMKIVASMPQDVVDAIKGGENIPLGTDPMAGSFVYHLANKKSQYDTRGHSLLEPCMLPGTPMTVSRAGVIQDIAVESVLASDLALTHKGRFMPLTAGSRPYDGDAVALSFDGIEAPLHLTAEHKVLILADDGTEQWIEARQVLPGMRVRESHPVSSGVIHEVDLVSWWKEHDPITVNRRRQGLRIIQIETVAADADGLVVTMSHARDGAGGCIRASELDGQILDWLRNIDVPAIATQAEVAIRFGRTTANVANSLVRLRQRHEVQVIRHDLGPSIWYPMPKEGSDPTRTYKVLQSPVSKFVIGPEVCYLIGAWLGDGCGWSAKDTFLNTPALSWSFGLNPIAEATKARIMASITIAFPGVAVVDAPFYANQPDSKATELTIWDELLSRWFRDEFGTKAQGKFLPAWVFDLPDECALALLQGLLDTDGCLSANGVLGFVVEITLDNAKLIHQIHLLCSRLGLDTRVSTCHKPAHSWSCSWWSKRKNCLIEKTYQVEAKNFAKLYCGRQPDVVTWAADTVKGSFKKWARPKRTFASRFQDGWLARRVTDTQTYSYSGPVFSFDVAEDKSHVTGSVVTHNCMRVLTFRDVLRQAQMSIASRHMTPMRLVWVENGDAVAVEELRAQVDWALQDPDYSIITNFQVNWEEMGSEQRLLDLTSEYDLTDRQLYAGLGVTEGLLSGESSYSGDRLHLEVINNRYMLMREVLQNYVEDYLFKPMCKKMGFVEEDEDGDEVVIFPTLTFTRLALRDNADTFDALYNLYTKGSLDIDVILDLLNIDPVTTREKLERDMFTVNDANYNSMLQAIYTDIGQKIAENTDLVQKVVEGLAVRSEKLTYTPPKEEGGGRFG